MLIKKKGTRMLFLNFGEKIITPEVAQMTVKNFVVYILQEFGTMVNWCSVTYIYIDAMYESILNYLQS